MSDQVGSVSEAVQRLSRRDPTIKAIRLNNEHYTDERLAELVDCLLAHPDAVTIVYLGGNQLTDKTGVKLARYLAASTTIESLSLVSNQFGVVTYLALAAALRVNSSLRCLYMFDNQAVDRTHIDAAFVEALRLNRHRPVGSVWWLCSSSNDFKRLKQAAEQLGHPSLFVLLCSENNLQLKRLDPTLTEIDLTWNDLTDRQLAELVDCLLAHPDAVTHVWLGYNRLTDKTGVKLARYIAASSTVEWLSLSNNLLGEETYLALAAALRVNSSLQFLSLMGNRAVDQTRIDAAFVESLRLNPDRPAESVWRLCTVLNDFKRVKAAAEQLGHPSLQLLLILH